MRGFLISSLLLSCLSLSASIKNDSSIHFLSDRAINAKVSPLIFYSPETKFGAGVAANLSFKISKKDSTIQSSNITVLASYTQLKQTLLLVPFKLIFPKKKWVSEGEFDYTNFLFSYWGNGNLAEKQETFRDNYTRFVSYLVRKMKYNFYGGFRFSYENHQFLEVDSSINSLLLHRSEIIGKQGGRYVGLGYQITYDNRDNIYAPFKGTLLSASTLYYNPFLGSTAKYARYTFDATKYLKIRPSQILVLDVYFDHTTGDVPFTQMAMMGGNKKVRGYYEGRYRDKNLLAFAVEYRMKIWRRIGGVLFANYGKVARLMPEVFNLSCYRYTAGFGARYMINTADRLNIRLDVGFGAKTQAFYLTIGEAL